MSLRPTRMEVSLGSLRRNYCSIRDHVRGSKVIGVLKANSYGMGAVAIAHALEKEGADFFAVATPDEAVELFESGVKGSILVLGSSPYAAADVYVKMGIRAAITDVKMAEAMSRAAVSQGRPAHIHLKVDSGMSRIGFQPSDTAKAAEAIVKLPGIDFEGVFTHFATSDEQDLSYTHKQFKAFASAVETIKNAGIKPRLVHSCNSAAILNNLAEMYLDAVRPGHILNGLIPSKYCAQPFKVEPCFEIKTAVGAVQELPEGVGVSYALTYTTSKPTRSAVLPIGYADGFSRGLSNKANVLIRGRRCPIIGRICMDQCMVDVTHLDEVYPGDEVVLLGRQGEEAITPDEWAELLSTIPVTLLVAFTARMPRVYI